MIGEPVRLASNRRHRLALRARACVFAVGVITAAAAVGGAFASLGTALLLPHHLVVDAAVGLLLAAALGRDLIGLPIPVPRRRWQVPRSWMRHFWFGAVGFGLAMGAGLLTFTSSYSFYLYLLICLLIGSATGGIWIGAFFGLCFVAAAYFGTAAWSRTPSPDKAARASALARVVGMIGAAASPLILSIPAAWIAITTVGK